MQAQGLRIPLDAKDAQPQGVSGLQEQKLEWTEEAREGMKKASVRTERFRVRDGWLNFADCCSAGWLGAGTVRRRDLPKDMAALFKRGGLYEVSFGRSERAVGAYIRVGQYYFWPARWAETEQAICFRLLRLLLPNARPGRRKVYISARRIRERKGA